MLDWSTTSSYQFTNDFRNPSISTDQLVNNSLNSYLDQNLHQIIINLVINLSMI